MRPRQDVRCCTGPIAGSACTPRLQVARSAPVARHRFPDHVGAQEQGCGALANLGIHAHNMVEIAQINGPHARARCACDARASAFLVDSATLTEDTRLLWLKSRSSFEPQLCSRVAASAAHITAAMAALHCSDRTAPCCSLACRICVAKDFGSEDRVCIADRPVVATCIVEELLEPIPVFRRDRSKPTALRALDLPAHEPRRRRAGVDAHAAFAEARRTHALRSRTVAAGSLRGRGSMPARHRRRRHSGRQGSARGTSPQYGRPRRRPRCFCTQGMHTAPAALAAHVGPATTFKPLATLHAGTMGEPHAGLAEAQSRSCRRTSHRHRQRSGHRLGRPGRSRRTESDRALLQRPTGIAWDATRPRRPLWRWTSPPPQRLRRRSIAPTHAPAASTSDAEHTNSAFMAMLHNSWLRPRATRRSSAWRRLCHKSHAMRIAV